MTVCCTQRIVLILEHANLCISFVSVWIVFTGGNMSKAYLPYSRFSPNLFVLDDEAPLE